MPRDPVFPTPTIRRQTMAWAGQPRLADRWRHRLVAIAAFLGGWRAQGRSLRQLDAMGDHQLRDLGLSRGEMRPERARRYRAP